MDKPTVYIETTIISYLAAWPSRDLLTAAHQQVTHEWWNEHRDRYELFLSRVVIEEISSGDPDAAARRLAYSQRLPKVEVTDDAAELAERLMDGGGLPSSAWRDALHLATTVTSGIQILLIWNCAHLANADREPVIREICLDNGFKPTMIKTPLELMGPHDVS